MTTGRSCTAGNEDFPTEDAVQWGACECGEGELGEDDGTGEENEVPLFEVGDKLLCAGCARDALEGGANES